MMSVVQDGAALASQSASGARANRSRSDPATTVQTFVLCSGSSAAAAAAAGKRHRLAHFPRALHACTCCHVVQDLSPTSYKHCRAHVGSNWPRTELSAGRLAVLMMRPLMRAVLLL